MTHNGWCVSEKLIFTFLYARLARLPQPFVTKLTPFPPPKHPTPPCSHFTSHPHMSHSTHLRLCPPRRRAGDWWYASFLEERLGGGVLSRNMPTPPRELRRCGSAVEEKQVHVTSLLGRDRGTGRQLSSTTRICPFLQWLPTSIHLCVESEQQRTRCVVGDCTRRILCGCYHSFKFLTEWRHVAAGGGFVLAQAVGAAAAGARLALGLRLRRVVALARLPALLLLSLVVLKASAAPHATPVRVNLLLHS